MGFDNTVTVAGDVTRYPENGPVVSLKELLSISLASFQPSSGLRRADDQS